MNEGFYILGFCFCIGLLVVAYRWFIFTPANADLDKIFHELVSANMRVRELEVKLASAESKALRDFQDFHALKNAVDGVMPILDHAPLATVNSQGDPLVNDEDIAAINALKNEMAKS